MPGLRLATADRDRRPRAVGGCTASLRTGKTTVARLIGRYLYAHGVLPRDTFVERNALALKGGAEQHADATWW